MNDADLITEVARFLVKGGKAPYVQPPSLCAVGESKGYSAEPYVNCTFAHIKSISDYKRWVRDGPGRWRLERY
jgi:hypothetical protein